MTLVIPAQSSSYKLYAQHVARLAGQKSTTYILAQADMPSLSGFDVSKQRIIPPT